MDKREQKLRGGLNALLGGSNTPTVEAPSPEVDTATPTEEELEREAEARREQLIDTIEDEDLRKALRAKRLKGRGRPRKGITLQTMESERYTRTTMIISRELLSKMKEICFRETLTFKEALEAVLSEAVRNYEETHGEVIPKKRDKDLTSLFKKSNDNK